MTTTLTHIVRYIRWGRTLARHGTLRIFEHHKEAPLSIRLIARVARFGTFAPKVPRYAVAFTALGPAAIKLGQALATRPDLVGVEAAKDFAMLQDQLPPFPFADAKAQIESALGAPLERLFASVDPVPVGAASIAQVHKAVTIDGKAVAVKVLRPNIEADIRSALQTYAWGAARLERLGGEATRLRPRQVIESFRNWVMRELDLRLEAASASELAEAMAGESHYYVPAVHWSLTAKNVLTIDWIDGIKLTDRAALGASGFDLGALARTAVQVFLKQAIDYGYFHADLHQGNLFLDSKGRLAAVDFGIMGRLDPLARRYLAEILYGLITRNYDRVAEIHFEAGYVPLHHSVADFAGALRAVGEPILGMPIKDVSPARLLDQLFAVTRAFDMPTQPHLLLLQKTMMMVEGLAVYLDPSANMWDISGPYLTEWVRRELGPEVRLADGLRRFIGNILGIGEAVVRAADTVPRKGAAPLAPPLPPLPEKRGFNGWQLAGAVVIGIVLGSLILSHL